MTRARKHLVCLSDTPYYHLTSRCVRRAFLCGSDKVTGNSYEHRREWIEDRIRVLSSIFCIDICAYAVMSNHYHLVVKINPSEADHWSDEEVLSRWTSLFRGPLIVQRFRDGASLSGIEMEALASIATVFRSRLRSLSWFMKCLNEPIARKANAEDQCTGHFWEARFHSEPLCSEQSLLAAMAYVDLNPVRARIAKTPETSSYTSIQARLKGNNDYKDVMASAARILENGELNQFNGPVKTLKVFHDSQSSPMLARNSIRNAKNDVLPMYEAEYFKLVDATGRVLVHNKRGWIDPSLAPILERLNLSIEQWVQVSSGFRRHYRQGHLRLQKSA